MRHARSDYDRIQDPAARDPSLLGPGGTPIGEDEPVFLIRAQDVSSGDAVRAWARLNDANGGDPEVSRIAREHAARMDAWPTKKVPDVPTNATDVRVVDDDDMRRPHEAEIARLRAAVVTFNGIPRFLPRGRVVTYAEVVLHSGLSQRDDYSVIVVHPDGTRRVFALGDEPVRTADGMVFKVSRTGGA